jgi:hypothetical protein
VGISLGNSCHVVKCTVASSGSGSGGMGISCGNACQVEGCVGSNCGTGPTGACISTGDDCHVEHCIAQTATTCISAGQHCDIGYCTACFAATNGIACGNNGVVHDCLAHNCGNDGIAVMQYCVAVNDNVTACGESGIDALGSYCRIDHNVCENNGTMHDRTDVGGVYVRNINCLVEGNYCANNFAFGFVCFTTNNVFKCNTAVQNNGSSFNNYAIGSGNDAAQFSTANAATSAFANITK